MFGAKQTKTFVKEFDAAIEDVRDDCIAVFLNSGLTRKKIHELGGPTPATISKWLYKETRFPRYSTIQSFTQALGYRMVMLPKETAVTVLKETPREERLILKEYKPTKRSRLVMPPKRTRLRDKIEARRAKGRTFVEKKD